MHRPTLDLKMVVKKWAWPWKREVQPIPLEPPLPSTAYEPVRTVSSLVLRPTIMYCRAFGRYSYRAVSRA